MSEDNKSLSHIFTAVVEPQWNEESDLILDQRKEEGGSKYNSLKTGLLFAAGISIAPLILFLDWVGLIGPVALVAIVLANIAIWRKR